MCSSYTTKSKTNKEVYEKNYGKPWLADDLAIEEKYHDASGEDAIGYPGSPMPVITIEKPDVIQAYQFGFIPHWLSPDKLNEQRATFNARIETITQLATWRDAWKNGQRCLVCTNGFFEHNKREKRKMFIHLKDEEFFYFGGIFNNYVNKQSGEIIKTMAVVTTASNSLIAEIHSRMPVMIQKNNAAAWIDPTASPQHILMQYSQPLNPSFMVMDYADDAPKTEKQGSLF